jgi:hypothetical protein
VGANCRCLNLSTSIGCTHSKVEGGNRHDLEPEGKIYTGSSNQSSVPYVLFGVVLRPALGVVPRRIVCSARYPALLYIVQGGGFLVGYKAGILVGLHRVSPSRSTGNSTRSLSASFLAVLGVYTRQFLIRQSTLPAIFVRLTLR